MAAEHLLGLCKQHTARRRLLLRDVADASERYHQDARHRACSRAFRCAGAMCIHPRQVAILNEEFGVRPDELVRARRIFAAYDEALAKGVGDR
jgi:citrate lyase beta subunit